MEEGRPSKPILALITLNSLLIGAAVVLVVVLARREPASAGEPALQRHPRSADVRPSESGPRIEDAADPVEAYLLSTVAAVRRAARDHGDDPDQVLPTEDDLRAAIDSRALDSRASTEVLGALRTAYARYQMPFPEPAGMVGAPPAASAGSDDAAIVQALIETTTARLSGAAEDAGEDPSVYLPTVEELAQARAATSLDADAVHRVLARLRAGYDHFGLAFPDPEQGGSSGVPR